MQLTLEILAGQLMPILIDLVNKRVPNSKVRYVIAINACLILGALFNYDRLSLENIPKVLESFATIFTSAQTAYKLYYENSHVQAKIRNPN
jgi:hypothetical protein